jgi:hypothetical protein
LLRSRAMLSSPFVRRRHSGPPFHNPPATSCRATSQQFHWRCGMGQRRDLRICGCGIAPAADPNRLMSVDESTAVFPRQIDPMRTMRLKRLNRSFSSIDVYRGMAIFARSVWNGACAAAA